MKKRPGECAMDYYDRLVLGDEKFDARERQWNEDARIRREEWAAVSSKTWGMGVNE